MLLKLTKNPMSGRILGINELEEEPYDPHLCEIIESDQFDAFMNTFPDRKPNIMEDKLYYVDGELVIKNDQLDFSDKERSLLSAINNMEHMISNKNISDYIVSGLSFDEISSIMIENKLQLEALKLELDELIQTYQTDEKIWLENVYAEELNKKDIQYYTTIVLLIKDENKYLSEWLHYYLDLMVDRIILYDNGNRESVIDIIDTFDPLDQAKIEVLNWKNYEGGHLQEDACKHAISEYGITTRWMAFVDSDEFIHIESPNLNEFLKSYEDYAGIHMNWVTYNANGLEHATDEPVLQRFTKEVPEPINKIYERQGKHIFQPHLIYGVYRYKPIYCKSCEMFVNDTLNLDIIQLKHIYTKSLEEWNYKINMRGSCDPDYRKGYHEFFDLNPDMIHLKDADTNYEEMYQSYMGSKNSML